MLNLIRKFLRPTLREQLEAGVREALRRYAERRTAPDLRVYVSTDLVPAGMDPHLWARDEAEHLRRFSAQWAEDNSIARAGLRLEMILLDTKREFAFVKPLGLDQPEQRAREAARPLVESPGGASTPVVGGRGSATLEVLESPAGEQALEVPGELTVGRRGGPGVHGLGDRYMSGRHARLRVENGQLWITDLDSKNRTFVNDQPLEPHRSVAVGEGATLRMGTTTFRVARIGR